MQDPLMKAKVILILQSYTIKKQLKSAKILEIQKNKQIILIISVHAMKRKMILIPPKCLFYSNKISKETFNPKKESYYLKLVGKTYFKEKEYESAAILFKSI
jgi:hypothetical protein